jgi:putative ABC transport system permease protein
VKRKNRARPSRVGQWILKKILPSEERRYFIEGIEERYERELADRGRLSALAWYLKDIFCTIPPLIIDNFSGKTIMIKNYLKIVWRTARKQKAYTLITLVGFALGMACCILIFLYVRFENSYDDFHSDADRIFRVALAWHTSDTVNYWATISTPAAWELKEKYPQVEKVARISNRGNQPVGYEEKLFYEEGCLYADPDTFEILSIPAIEGNPKAALNRPGTTILTQRMAKKYFGDKDPLGQSIRIGNDNLEIAAVIADAPENTHLKYNFIGRSSIKR